LNFRKRLLHMVSIPTTADKCSYFRAPTVVLVFIVQDTKIEFWLYGHTWWYSTSTEFNSLHSELHPAFSWMWWIHQRYIENSSPYRKWAGFAFMFECSMGREEEQEMRR
jgi:hypothetical protein